MAVFAVILLLIGPLIVPVPPLTNTYPPEALADPDSVFMDIAGLKVHMKVRGSDDPVILLLHGFGSSTFSWEEVIGPLGQIGTAVAFDRPGFGLTSRPMYREWTRNPYSMEAHTDLCIAVLDAVGAQKAVVIGHSAGGNIAVLAALKYPERVSALILVDAAVLLDSGLPSSSRIVLRSMYSRRLGPVVARTIADRANEALALAWYDESKITERVREGYTKPLKVHNWDKALWEFTIAARPQNLRERLPEITVPTLVMTGSHDRLVPPHHAHELAKLIEGSTLVVIDNCGHVPQEETPQEFLNAVIPFIRSLGGSKP